MDKVRNYVRRHLQVSSKHYLSNQEAIELAMTCEIITLEEPFHERDQYRKSLAPSANLKPKAKARCPQSPRRNSRSPRRGDSAARGSDASELGQLSGDIRHLTATMGDLVRMQVAQSRSPPQPSSAPARDLRMQTSEAMVAVPASSLRLLASSLGQIRECVERLTVLTPVLANAQAAMEHLSAQGR